MGLRRRRLRLTILRRRPVEEVVVFRGSWWCRWMVVVVVHVFGWRVVGGGCQGVSGTEWKSECMARREEGGLGVNWVRMLATCEGWRCG